MCLLPNATHIIQPWDVVIFRPLKVAWRNQMIKYKQHTTKPVTKASFAPLFQGAFTKITEKTVKKGFEVCGLYPFNPDAVDYTKCISTRREQLRDMPKVSQSEGKKFSQTEYKTALQIVEGETPKGVVGFFNNIYERNGEPADSEQKGFYTIWKVIKDYTLNKMPPPTDTQTEKSKEMKIHEESLLSEVVGGEEEEVKEQFGIQEYQVRTKESEQSPVIEVSIHLNDKITDKEVTSHEEQTGKIFNLSDVLVSYDDLEINMSNSNNSDFSPDIDICTTVEIEGSELLPSEPRTSENPNVIWDKHLHWPQVPTEKPAKKTKEHMPFAFTSTKWKEYNDKKDKVKKEKDKLRKTTVRKRKADRDQKKEMLEQEKRKKKESRQKLNRLIEQKNVEIKRKLAEFKKA